MALFDSGLTNISILIDQPFPSNVVSGPGIQVDKTSSVWSVGLDFTDLTDGGSPATPSNVFLAGYDVALQRYEKLRLDNMIAGATGLDARTPRGDADYSILIADRYIGLTAALTAIRTWTLPAANAVPAGRVVRIQDEAGGISAASHINCVPTGSDTLNGLANYRLKTKFGGVAFRSDGSSKWSIAYSWQVSAVADANYTAQQGDLIIAYTSITAARTVTLPAANAYPAGQRLTIIDFSGSCSGTSTIGISRSSTDLINGATSQAISQAYGYLALISDGASKWTIVDSSTVTSTQISDSTAMGRSVITGNRRVVGDTNYTILPSDAYVVTSTLLTAPRTWTLPAANSVPAGAEIVIVDEGRATTPTNTITITRAGTDTINIAGTATTMGARVLQAVRFRSDGVSNWSFPGLFGAYDGFPIGSTTPAGGAFTTLAFNTTFTGTSTSANALAVGRQGATNPALNVDASTASSATGVNIRALAAGNGALVQASSSGTNENLVLDAKGAATVFLGANSTGGVNLASGGGQVTFNTAPASFLNMGRLSVQDATHLIFKPYNGSMIKINGSQYLIPSAGVTLTNGAFSASTFYYIYAFVSGGNVALENSATSHVTDTTAGNVGVEIKSGDSTRTLVGAVFSNGSAQFVDSDTSRTVLSWFNRQPKRLQNAFTATRTTSSTSFVEINSEIRCNFIAWADDPPKIGYLGFVENSGANGTLTAIGRDGLSNIIGTVVTIGQGTAGPATAIVPITDTGVAEGAPHFFTLAGVVGAGTGSWQKGSSIVGDQFPTLLGELRG